MVAAAIVAARRLRATTLTAVATLGLMAALAGPTAYTLSAVATAQSGTNPAAGPAKSFDAGPRDQAVSATLSALLGRDSSRYTWVAATSSTQNGATLELATGQPVMAIGGFSGSDPAITLAGFEQLVAQGKIHFYVAGGGPGDSFGGRLGALGSAAGDLPAGFGPPGGGAPGGGAPGGGAPGAPGGGRPPGFGGGARGFGGGQNTVASQIQSWVKSHYKSSTVGGTTVYNLTHPRTG